MSSITRASENVHRNHFLSGALSEFRTHQIKSCFYSNSKYLAIAVSIYFIKVAK